LRYLELRSINNFKVIKLIKVKLSNILVITTIELI